MGTVALPRSCPNAAQVRRLAAGSVTDREAELVEAHLGECSSCVALFERETASLDQEIRAAVPDQPAEAEDEFIRRLIDRIERVDRPAEEPASESVPSTFAEQHHTQVFAGHAQPGSSPADRPASTPTDPASGLQSRLLAEVRRLLSPPQSPEELGRLGAYRVLRMLGRGGMGMVFEADDPRLSRRVALKIILPTAGGWEEERRLRFFREARAVAALDHDNIVPIYEADEDRGVPYLVMPLLKGESLAARLQREKRLSTPVALAVARETAQGLSAAHAAGLLHRDLKPENLWLEDRGGAIRVRVLDFGLACWQDGTNAMTGSGMLMGTPQYMAPEQARGEPTDSRADLFSLGCVLYRMLTGKRPFDGPNTTAVLRALELHDPPEPAEIEPGVPAWVSGLVMHLLEKRADDRPPSARETIEALLADGDLRAQAGPKTITHAPARKTPAATTPAQTAESPQRSGPRRRAYLIASFVAVVLGLAGVTIIVDLPDGKRITVTVDDRPKATAAVPDTPPTNATSSVERPPFETAQKLIEDEKFDDAMAWMAKALRDSPADSPDRRMILTALDTLHPKFHEPIARFAHEKRAMCDAFFHADGTQILMVARDGEARLWDIATAKLLQRYRYDEAQGRVCGAALRPDGRILATTTGGWVWLWDVASGERTGQPLPVESATSGRLAFSPDGKRLFGAFGTQHPDGGLWAWQLDGSPPVAKLLARGFGRKGLSDIAVAKNALIGVAGFHGFAFFDGATLEQRGSHPMELDFMSASISSDGEWFAGGPSGSGSAYVLHRPSESFRAQHPPRRSGPPSLPSVAFSPDDRLLLTGGMDDRIAVWDVASHAGLGRPLTVGPQRMIERLRFSRDGQHLAVTTNPPEGGSAVQIRHAPRPLPDEPDRISAWAASVSQREVTTDGRLRPLEPVEIEQARAKLADLGGPPPP